MRPASPALLARLAMIFATTVWGATFVVVERAIQDLPVFHLLAYRFGLAALLLAWWARRSLRAGDPAVRRDLLRDGLLVGIALFVSYTFQTFGLVWTTPSRSAFLTGLSVLFVPLFGWLAGRLQPHPLSLAGALCALAGLWALFQPWGTAGAAPFNLGDALTVACAAGFALHVLLVERAVRRYPVVPLAALQFAIVAALSAPALGFEPPAPHHLSTVTVGAVLITGVLATAAAFACQLYAQRHLGAVETAVLLTLEPVVAAVLSLAIGREALSAALVIGGVLIVTGMLLADVGSPPPEPPGAAAPRA